MKRETSNVKRSRTRSAETAQTFAELALVFPLLVFMVLGLLQLSLLGYGNFIAKYAAFVGARAGAVSPFRGRMDAVREAVTGTLARMPAVRFERFSLRRTPLPLLGTPDAGQLRMTCTVVVIVPRLLPIPYPVTTAASSAMPMEPVFPK